MRASTAILLGIGALFLLVGAVAGLGAVLTKSRADRAAKAPDPQPRAEPEKAAGPTTPTAPAGPEPTAQELWDRADVREPADALARAYQGNAVAADKRFKGKLVGTSGLVQKIDVDPLGKGEGILVLSVGDDPLTFEVVTCQFDKAHTDELADLAAGNAVAVVGRGKGKISLAIHLGHCRLLRREESNDALLNWINRPRGKR